MENNILQHRLAVQQNISKAFENDFDADIEKGKWQVGMTKQYQGKTYKVGGFNAKGNPLWKLVKNDNGGGKSDEGGSKQQEDSEADRNSKERKNESDKDEPSVISDNYSTASEKLGRHAKRNEYGWKVSAAGKDARELDEEE